MEACATIAENGPEITQQVFSDPEDFASQGNAPLEETPSRVLPLLDAFWAASFAQAFAEAGEYASVANVTEFQGPVPDCGGGAVPDDTDLFFYCPSTETLGYSLGAETEELYSYFGDSLVALGLSDRWGYGMRHKAGEVLEGVDAGLQVDCTSGAFFRYAFDESRLSPGDLDEAVALLLASSLYFDSLNARRASL